MKQKLNWDLTKIYKNINDKKISLDIKLVEKNIDSFVTKYSKNKSYLNSPTQLKKALDDYNSLLTKTGTSGDFGYYFSMLSAQNQLDSKVKNKLSFAEEFEAKMNNKLLFFTYSIAKLPVSKQKKFLKSPLLKNYKKFLNDLFLEAKYLLSEGEEKILSLKQQVAHQNWENMVKALLSKQEAKVINEQGKITKTNFSTLLSNLTSDNKQVRRQSAGAINKILKRNLFIVENEINSILQNKKINDELRGFKTPDEARLLSEGVSVKFVHTLLKEVTNNFKISKDYYKLKAKLTGYKKLKYEDRNISVGDISKKYSYEDSIHIIRQALTKMDSSLVSVFNSFLQNGQIDVYPKKGKRHGAFCTVAKKGLPTLILLNYTNKITDVTTFAHEFGHAMHHILYGNAQPQIYNHSSMAVAEVASTFLEDYALEEIKQKLNKEQQLVLLMEKLNDDVSSVFRQVAFYNFELDLHNTYKKQGYLSSKQIGELFSKHMKSYMGSFVEHPLESHNWWVFVPHFRYFFYVYSYASGALLSKALQAKLKEDPKFINDYKNILKVGDSKTPKDTFKMVGINVEKPQIWQKGLQQIKTNLNEAKLLAKELKKY